MSAAAGNDLAPIRGVRFERVALERVEKRDGDAAVAAIASAIGEPARARMLYCLLDDRARTSTELALVAGEFRRPPAILQATI